jgi:hypothetical protein
MRISRLMPCDTRTSPGRKGSGLERRWRGSNVPFVIVELSPTLADHLPYSGRFWLRLPKATTATCRRRFLATWSDYAASVAREAEHRTESRILDVEIYVPLRRNTIGALPVFALWELDMDIPDDVREHPTLRKMVALGAEIIAIDNVSSFSFDKDLRATRYLPIPLRIGHPLVQQGAGEP